MKHLKKLLVAFVTLVAAFAVATPAFAGSITINRDETYGGTSGRTYTAYKVFDASNSLTGTNTQADKQPTYAEDGPIAYSMATDSPWLDAMRASDQTWFDVNLAADGSAYVVTPKGDLTDADAADIASYLKTNLPSGLAGTTVTPGTATTVDDGYYLILASDGATNVTLVTTDVTIVEKNTYIETHKETEETSYSIGDTIEYTATVTVPADASKEQPITLHDEMASVLAFDADSVEATVDGAEFTGFSVVSAPEDDCTFELTIPVTDAILGKTIEFTYEAELTSAAVNPDTGFINKLFGEHYGYKTNPEQPKIYTFDFDFVKVFDDEDDTNLTATFELRTDADDEDTAIEFVVDADGNYVKADSNDSGTTEITMTNGKALNFQGFAAGTYYLVETGTSAGYNLLDGPVTITITDTSTDDTISHTVTPVNALDQVEVENHAGTVLPSTGGMGTTLFYIVGGLMVAGAAIALIAKNRVAKREA